MSLWRRLHRGLEGDAASGLEPRSGYERWAKTYSRENNPVLHLEGKTIEKLLPDVSGKRALDLGCGAGRIIQLLAERGASFLVGLDFSFQMLMKAREPWRADATIQFAAADARALPVADESFDTVTCSLLMGHIERLEPAVSELARVTRPGGTVLISDFHPFAQLLGWKRSFGESRDGRLSEFYIHNYRHLHEDYFRAFTTVNLQVEAVCEPCIDESVEHFFVASRRRRKMYRRFAGYPIVLAFRLTSR